MSLLPWKVILGLILTRPSRWKGKIKMYKEVMEEKFWSINNNKLFEQKIDNGEVI